MMTCKQCAELLIDFVAGELSDEHTIVVREHLSMCGPCERFLATYEHTIKLTRQLPMVSMPESLLERLHRALREIENGDRPSCEG